MPATARLLLPALAMLALIPAAHAAPTPDASSGVVKHGVDLWQAHDYEGAVAAWRGPAEAGDADAQFNLGQAYKLGNGVPADLRQAEAWYRKAAEQGHIQAQGLLGVVMFQNGDHAGAVPWLKMAAERGDPRAAYVFGTMLFNADAVPKDWPRAYAYTTRAAAAGLPQARSSLAQMDQFIPAGDRRKGLAMARDMGKAGPQRTAAAAPPPAPAPEMPLGPERAPIRTAQLPPSSAAATPAPHPAPAPRVRPAPVPHPAPAPRVRPAPVPRPAAVAAAAPAPRSGGWRVQLGAFSDESKARAAWAGFAGKPGLRGLHPLFVRAGSVTRLQAGGLPSRADAARACQSAGGGCFPVAP